MGQYALAYAGLTEAYGNLGVRGYIAPSEGRRKAEEAARKALDLDENLAEAHVALGQVYVYLAPHDFSLGDRQLRRAIELSPSLAIAHQALGLSLVRQGRLDEGLAEYLKARELDPLSSIIAWLVATAIRIVKELEEMSGAGLSQAHYIAKVYAALNEKELAFSWLERGLATGAIGGFYKDEPVWDAIRSDARFGDLLRRMGVPQ